MSSPTLRVLSLGAGLDSTTLLLMSEAGELPRLDCAIFADTHAEPAHVYATLDYLAQATSIPLYRVSAGNLRSDILAVAHAGARPKNAAHPPFWVQNTPNTTYATAERGAQLWRTCTMDYKIVPIRQQIRALLGVKPTGRLPKYVHVEQWIGFTLDDLGRTFCSNVQWITNVFPLILPKRLRRRDCAAWLTQHGHPIPQKSSCTFCPYHSNAAWRAMRDERPQEWAATVAFEQQLQAGRLPGVRGQVYLHRSMVPLSHALIDTVEQEPPLFCFACNT